MTKELICAIENNFGVNFNFAGIARRRYFKRKTSSVSLWQQSPGFPDLDRSKSGLVLKETYNSKSTNLKGLEEWSIPLANISPERKRRSHWRSHFRKGVKLLSNEWQILCVIKAQKNYPHSRSYSVFSRLTLALKNFTLISEIWRVVNQLQNSNFSSRKQALWGNISQVHLVIISGHVLISCRHTS